MSFPWIRLRLGKEKQQYAGAQRAVLASDHRVRKRSIATRTLTKGWTSRNYRESTRREAVCQRGKSFILAAVPLAQKKPRR